MATFGKVLDLLDDRCLQLHDVVGNVEPMPRLVPQQKYSENVHVYRMDTNQEVFMALMQELTVRVSRQVQTELWTWCIQWKVDANSPIAPSPKKARLDDDEPKDDVNAEETQPHAQSRDASSIQHC
jgi:hypothetical protein